MGSLTPGKQADVVADRRERAGTAPVIDPVGTVVLAADTANVERSSSADRSGSGTGRLPATGHRPARKCGPRASTCRKPSRRGRRPPADPASATSAPSVPRLWV